MNGTRNDMPEEELINEPEAVEMEKAEATERQQKTHDQQRISGDPVIINR